VIASIGGSTEAFEAYVHGPARAEHDRIIDEAEALGCSACRPCLQWRIVWRGDRVDMLIAAHQESGTRDRDGAGQPTTGK